jgi:MazG family protein
MSTAFSRLVSIVGALRSPEGCPWDREQTLASLARYVLEEAYEVVDAIERDDLVALREEVGDHIFEGVFLAQIAAERGAFDVEAALTTVADKLVRRHPHVFQPDGRIHDAVSRERAPSADAALARWEAQKAADRAAAGASTSALAGLPAAMPALLRAATLGKRAASAGFDWIGPGNVLDKIEEELTELRQTVTDAPTDRARAEEEMGDLLLALANLARKLDIEPEAALRKANAKFTKRFTDMEHRIATAGRAMTCMSSDELDVEWRRSK